MAGQTTIRTIQLPTVSVSDTTLKLDCKWTKQYGSGDEAKYTDTYWNINGYWWDHEWGTSPAESATYECQLEEIKGWAPKWKPIKSVQFCTRYVYEGWMGGWCYSPILYLETPKCPEVTIKQTEVDGVPHIEVSVEREASTWNCPILCMDIFMPSIVPPPDFVGPIQQRSYMTTDESWSKSFPMSEFVTGEPTVPKAVNVRAVARGLAGNSQTVTNTYYISHPNAPRIKAITANRGDLTSAVVVSYDVNADVTHPVDTVELQRLKDSDEEFASGAATADGWDTGIATADSRSVSMCDALSDAIPSSRGKRTWYRLKATHGSHYTYSLPFQLPIYDEPLDVATMGCYISSVEEADDGSSLAVEIAWRDFVLPGATDAEIAKFALSTEVSWGMSPYSWQSNKGADTFEFDWECDGSEKTERLSVINGNRPSVAGEPVEEFTHVGVVYIDGLDENSVFYIKARRKWDDGEDSGFGDYSNIAVASMSGDGNLVLLTAPSVVKRGDGIGLMWTLGVDAKQSQWLVSGVVGPDEDMMDNFVSLAAADPTEKAQAYAALDNACVGLAQGYDAGGYAVIEPDAFDGADTVIVKVSVTIGGMTDESAYALISVSDAPVCEVSAPDTVEETPASITVRTSAGNTAVVSVISRGIAYATPSGMEYQLSGDVVLGGVKAIEDFELADDGLYEGTISLEGAHLVDGATYDVHAYVTDEVTGLSSEVASDSFTVAWEHQASAPSALIAADNSTLTAKITVQAPEGAQTTDVCDVYRVTPHGADIIASDIEFGSTVTDRFAPYVSRREKTETVYRIACRTKDGDVAFTDIPYILHASELRMSWGEDSELALPYNLTASESASKLFEAKTMLDGSRVGSWQEGVERNGGFSTDLIRFESAEQRRLVNEVAAYPGPVFVRSGSGIGMEADVQIESVEESYESGAIAVSLAFTQIDLTAAHRCAIDDIEEPDEQL